MMGSVLTMMVWRDRGVRFYFRAFASVLLGLGVKVADGGGDCATKHIAEQLTKVNVFA